MPENGGLSPEELKDLELDNVPAFQRKEKTEERRSLTQRLIGPLLKLINRKGEAIKKPSIISEETGGISSKLDPVNPQNRELGEPTIPITNEDIKPPSKN